MNKLIEVQKTLTINRPAEELYRFWRKFENLPTFMKHLLDVKVYDDKRSHWTTKGPLDTKVEWDAKIIEEKENELIAWASVEGADVNNSGYASFKRAPANRGTEVTVLTKYNPPAGGVGDTIAKLFGENPQQQIAEDLRRFKMLMETGEIATTEGQPHGGKK